LQAEAQIRETMERLRLVTEAAERAKGEAEQANRAKSDFLANMSHEIRTPMTVFMGAIEHLLHIEQDPAHRTLLKMAEQSAERLRSLIDDILDLSRIEARGMEIEESEFELRSCVSSAVGLFSLTAREKNLGLETEVAPEVPERVIGDPDKLGQVLINLIGNALKFTHEGKVRVTVLRRIDILEFAVADTGIGIPEEKQHLLFQSFSQTDSSFQRRYGGSGLGLAISKGLVELMGGQVDVQSRKGKGSVFTFTLPLKAGSENQRPSLPAEPPIEGPVKEGPSARILLAEDDPMVQKMVQMMLFQGGWQPEIAETGREVLKKVGARKVRSDPDGSSDAGNERYRGNPRDPQKGGGRRREAHLHHRPDRPRTPRNKRRMPERGYE
jgi:nitrogen-specific signal transduction histidine kinase